MSGLPALSHAEGGAVRNLIGGQLVHAAGGATLEDRDPARDRVLATIPRSGPEDVAAAVAAADAARGGEWGSSSYEERADLLERVADTIEARLDELRIELPLACEAPRSTNR